MISDDESLLGGDVLVTEEQRTIFVATEKTGHEINAEKPEYICTCFVKKM